MEEKYYPGSSYQNLFNYLYEEHGLTLLESQMNDLINVVHKFHPAGAVWVKAAERQPQNSDLVHLQYGTGHTNFKLTGYYEPSENKWHRQDTGLLDWAPGLEWLDESGTPAAAREEDAVLLIKYIRENYKKRKDGWTDNFNIARVTDQGIYELFKQQKEK